MADPTTQGPLSTVTSNQDSDIPQSNTAATIGQPVKITGGGKGTLASITPTAGAVLDEQSSKAILSNMQKLLNEYDSPEKKFQDALMKAHAWTVYDKTPAFQQIQAQEEQDRANKYNIGQSMASIQAMQNQNKILADTMGATPGATGVAGSMTPMQQSIASLPESERAWASYLARTNPAEFFKMVQANELKKPDQLKMLETLKGMDYTPQNEAWARQNFPNMFAPQKTIVNGVATEYSPDPKSLFKPSGATTQAAVSGNVPAFSDPSIKITSAKRDNATQQSLYNKSIANGTPGTLPDGTPVAKPGTSPHENLPFGDVLDIDPTTLTTPGRTELAQKGYYQPYGKDSPHWQKIPPVGTGVTTARAPTAGEQDTSVPGVSQQYENLKTANAAIGKTFETLQSNKDAYNNNITAADAAIRAVDEGKEEEQGPGTNIKQGYIYAKIAANIPVDPDELARYSRNLTIEQAKQQFVAQGAKAAMGAQYTGKEADNFAKTLASINDPSNYIKTTFQIVKAKNLVDLAHLKFLADYPKDLLGGEKAWDNSGMREKIFKDTVTAFKEKAPAAGGGDIAAQAKQRFKAYEPEKYNYGFENGKFYREPK